jgi:hypothetical protein
MPTTIDGGTGASQIQDGTVIAAKIAAGAVTETKIADTAVTTNKLATGERMNTTNVLAATAGAEVGAVGTYAFLYRPTNGGVAAGTTLAGSGLRYAGLSWAAICASVPLVQQSFVATTPAGTWRAMGGIAPNSHTSTLYLRIS